MSPAAPSYNPGLNAIRDAEQNSIRPNFSSVDSGDSNVVQFPSQDNAAEDGAYAPASSQESNPGLSSQSGSQESDLGFNSQSGDQENASNSRNGVINFPSSHPDETSGNIRPTGNNNLVNFPGVDKSARHSSDKGASHNADRNAGRNTGNPLKSAESVKSPTSSGAGAGFTNGGFNQNNLSAAESAIPSSQYQNSGGVAGNTFTNAVSGKGASKTKGNGAFWGLLKKFGPIGATVALISSIAGFSFLGQSTQLLSYTELIKERYGTVLQTVQDKRSKNWLKYTIDPENRDPVAKISKTSKIFSTEKFKINAFQKRKLKAAGFEVDGKYIKYDGKLYAAGPESAKRAAAKGIDAEDIQEALTKNIPCAKKCREPQ